MRPLSANLRLLPSMVWVFPDEVCPYAKMVPLYLEKDPVLSTYHHNHFTHSCTTSHCLYHCAHLRTNSHHSQPIWRPIEWEVLFSVGTLFYRVTATISQTVVFLPREEGIDHVCCNFVKHVLLGCRLVKHVAELEGVVGWGCPGVPRPWTLVDVILVSDADTDHVLFRYDPHTFERMICGANSCIDLNLRHHITRTDKAG